MAANPATSLQDLIEYSFREPQPRQQDRFSFIEDPADLNATLLRGRASIGRSASTPRT